MPTTADEAKDSILDLITVAIGNDKSTIPMDEVRGVLHQQGWDLTPGMIMDVLKDNEMIRQITKPEIILNNESGDDSTDYSNDDKVEKDKDHVSKMAKKGAKKKKPKQGAV
jgi:hypothetical protein